MVLQIPSSSTRRLLNIYVQLLRKKGEGHRSLLYAVFFAHWENTVTTSRVDGKRLDVLVDLWASCVHLWEEAINIFLEDTRDNFVD
jgi:hypothetical protein